MSDANPVDSRTRFASRSLRRPAPPESSDRSNLRVLCRVVLRTLAVIAGLGALVSAVSLHQASPSNFTLFYKDAQHVWAGLPLHVEATRNLNPPLLLWFTMPLARFPLPTAFVLWTLASLVVAAVATVQIARVADMHPLDIFVGALISQAGAVTLLEGTTTFFLMPVMTIAWLAERRGRQEQSGAALGILCLMKPFYGLFLLLMIWRRSWRQLGAACLTGAGGAMLGYLLAGSEGYATWLSNLSHVTWQAHTQNGSMWGVAARLFTAYGDIDGLPEPFVSPALYALTGWMGTMIVAAVTAYRLPKADTDERYALLSVAALLMSPLGWHHYLLVGLGPILAVWSRRLYPLAWFAPILFALVPPEFVALLTHEFVATGWWFVLFISLWVLLLYQRGQPKDDGMGATAVAAAAHA